MAHFQTKTAVEAAL